jgi:hypothetical protein
MDQFDHGLSHIAKFSGVIENGWTGSKRVDGVFIHV